MPELAEVEYFRRVWNAGLGQQVLTVHLHRKKRVFREADPAEIIGALTGARLLRSEARGKQLLFQFSRGGWLGIHLGMTGRLEVRPSHHRPEKHEHLVLVQKRRTLIFRDPRMFGRVRFQKGRQSPVWWSSLPAPISSDDFTLPRMHASFSRRGRAPLKAVLLDQALFPGIGNWMADEILWQSRLDPRATTGSLSRPQVRLLWQKTRAICSTALRTIGVDWSDPPAHWLLHVRWKRSGVCPRHEEPLRRATIAGRTTIWCAQCQPPHDTGGRAEL